MSTLAEVESAVKALPLPQQKELLQRTKAGSIELVSLEVRRVRREMFVRHADRLRELLTQGGAYAKLYELQLQDDPTEPAA